MNGQSIDGFVNEIKNIIDEARAKAVRSIDLCRVRADALLFSFIISVIP